MVEEVLKQIRSRKSEVGSLILIDVGTGSGCIPISIIKTVKHENMKAYAIDISKPALQVAQKNAKIHEVNINFLYGNLLEPFLKTLNSISEIPNSIVITANLPYLTQEQFNNESSIQHEPYSALVTEEQGLKLYKELLKQLQQLLSAGKFQLTIFFETDPSQTTLIISEIKKSLPAAQIEVVPDLAGRDRVVCFKVSN
jgi:release factor glutamine methyltransferase